MNLNEFIEKNKIGKDTFIAIHNKSDIWIICDTISSGNLVDYMNLDVIDHLIMSKFLVRVNLDYDADLSTAAVHAKEEAKSNVRIRVHGAEDPDTVRSSKKRAKKNK